jgi:hypothetical protein
VFAHPADVGDLAAEAVPHGLDVGFVVHAGNQAQQVDDVAPAALDLRDLGRSEQARIIAVLRLDRRPFGDHRHDLGQLADLEPQAPQIDAAAGVEDVVLLLERAEAGQLDPDGVGSRRHGPERESPAIVAGGGAGVSGGFIGERHGGSARSGRWSRRRYRTRHPCPGPRRARRTRQG